ncbi:hypothetical protein N1851_013007 [Merluccius polli]|uniref:Uncharacterized protein n=1 Tax=Merluccius polli TaxID=89951 RepID=A0AA47P3Z9_MERPO|nr:hypothetical protein N1851_013007 [Merluccius polli]
MAAFRPVLLFFPLVLLVQQSCSFELQDTIHALIEENIHLHDQLENLTQALRELKRMLWHHSNDESHPNDHHSDHHNEDARHMWNDWSAHGISAETHLLLEHALCGHDPNNSGSFHVQTPFLLLLLALLYVTLLLSGSI